MRRFKRFIDNVSSSQGAKTSMESSQDQTVEKIPGPNLKKAPNGQIIVRPAAMPIDEYFDACVDNSHSEIIKLPVGASREVIYETCEGLRMHLENVSKRLSDVILENQQSYDTELQRVRDLQKTLQIAFSTCHAGRNHIPTSRSSRRLYLLIQIKRKRNLTNLFIALSTIKTLEHTDVHLRELMENERYPEAIRLCLECQKVSNEYAHYSCIKDLSVKLQDTIEQIEEQMDDALSTVCSKFDEQTYEKLQTGYKLLGKRETAVDQLLMHFATCIRNSTIQNILKYMKAGAKEDASILHKKQFADLCLNIDPSSYIPCLTTLCKGLTNVMRCYQKIFNWHRDEFLKISSSKTLDTGLGHKYVLQKLGKGRQRIWLDVQSRVRHVLASVNVSNFKYEEFTKVIGVVNTFLSVGARFSGSMEREIEKFSSDLQEPIYQLSLQYFHAYHKKSLDELHMFLSNEAWEVCPLQPNFTVFQLPEFTSLYANNRKNRKSISERNLTSIEEMGRCDEFEDVGSDVYGFSNSPGPDMLNSSDLKDIALPEVHAKEASSEGLGNNENDHGPLFTNSALNTLRICGKYLALCEVLKPVATDIVINMSRLFDLYFAWVYRTFARQPASSLEYSKKLSATLDRISREFKSILPEITDISFDNRLAPNINGKLSQTELQTGVTAAESLVNLAEQFRQLRPVLDKILRQTQKAFLEQFYAQTVDVSSEVRSQVYFVAAAQALDYNLILREVPQVRWDIREIMSQHSRYVDGLLGQFLLFKSVLATSLSDISSRYEIEMILWSHCVKLCNESFVEGYSMVKKCSNEGRALMQLDYQQFISKAEDITGLSPAPGKFYVEGYLKAFYLSEDDYEQWMENHKEYTEKQLLALLACISSATNFARKSRKQKMRSMLEDITGRK